MSAPAYTRPWSFDVANAVAAQASALATNRKLLREIVTGLIASGCTVQYSCDSVAAGVEGDGVNRWDADTDLVFAAGGVAHSWIVLRLPSTFGASVDLLLDLENSATGSSASLYLSHAAFTGGSTTVRPTEVDEIEITHLAAQILQTSNINYTWHLAWSVDSIRLFIYQSGGVAPIALLMIEHVAGGPAGWSNCLIAGHRYDAGSGVGDLSSWTGTVLRGYGSSGAEQFGFDVVAPPTDVGIDGTYLLAPVRVYSSQVELFATVRDMYFVNPSVVPFDTYPAAGATDGVESRRWITLQEMVTPWDGSDPGGGSVGRDASILDGGQWGTGCLLSVSPEPGELDDDPEAARWTKITLVVDVAEGYEPVVHCYFGSAPAVRHVAFDGEAFAPFFADKGTVTVSDRRYTFELLPIGGWWDAPTIRVGAFAELLDGTEAPPGGGGS